MGKKLEKKLKGIKGIKDGNQGLRTGKWSFDRGPAVLMSNISGCSILPGEPGEVVGGLESVVWEMVVVL